MNARNEVLSSGSVVASWPAIKRKPDGNASSRKSQRPSEILERLEIWDERLQRALKIELDCGVRFHFLVSASDALCPALQAAPDRIHAIKFCRLDAPLRRLGFRVGRIRH